MEHELLLCYLVNLLFLLRRQHGRVLRTQGELLLPRIRVLHLFLVQRRSRVSLDEWAYVSHRLWRVLVRWLQRRERILVEAGLRPSSLKTMLIPDDRVRCLVVDLGAELDAGSLKLLLLLKCQRHGRFNLLLLFLLGDLEGCHSTELALGTLQAILHNVLACLLTQLSRNGVEHVRV